MRMYEMFMGPLEVSKPWATTGLVGVYRFLDRIYRLFEERAIVDEEPSDELNRTLHKTIKKVTWDTNTLNFNTAISQMMVLVNELYKIDVLPKVVAETLVKLLGPYVPHLAEELWERLGHNGSLSTAAWPQFVEELTVDNQIEMVFQINGKVRSKTTVPKGFGKDEVLAMAKRDEKLASWLEGKTIVKEIVVVDKLVNIVVK